MATIAIPSSPGFSNIEAINRNSTKLSMSPYNFNQQVYSWEGKLKIVQLTLPPMKLADATNWSQFLDDLNGFENTFNLDLSDYYPHESGITSVAMRLTNPDTAYSYRVNKTYEFSFIAMEAK